MTEPGTKLLAGSLLALLLAGGPPATADDGPATETLIVQASSAEVAAAAVVRVGGKVTHELRIIRAVGAELTAVQRQALIEETPEIRIFANRRAEVDSAGCAVAGGSRLLEGNKLLWDLSNLGSETVTLTGI